MAAACTTAGSETTSAAETADTGNGNADGSNTFDAVVAAAVDAASSPFVPRPKCARRGCTNDATMVGVHCGCVAACASCVNQEPHATRSRKCFKCNKPVTAYVQVNGDVSATLPPPGQMGAEEEDEEETDVDEEEEG